MLLRPHDFYKDVECTFGESPIGALRAFTRWQLQKVLMHDNSLALIANCIGLNGNHLITWRPIVLLTRNSRKNSYTVQGDAFIHDQATHLLSMHSNADTNLTSIDDLSEEELLDITFPSLPETVADNRRFDRNFTLREYNFAKLQTEKHDLAGNVANRLLKIIDHRIQTEGQPALIKAGEDKKIRQELTRLASQRVLDHLDSIDAAFMGTLDKMLAARLKEMPSLSFIAYNLAVSSNRESDFRRQQRLDAVSGPYAHFLPPLDDISSDPISQRVLDNCEEGLVMPAAIASALKVKPDTIIQLQAHKPPRTYRSWLYSLKEAPHIAMQSLAIALNSTPVQAWPQNDDEWQAFYRLQEIITIDPSTIPGKPDQFIARLARSESDRDMRWHRIESRLMHFVVPAIKPRPRSKVLSEWARRNKEPAVRSVQGQYWIAYYDANNTLVGDIDVDYTHLRRRLAPAYEKFYGLDRINKQNILTAAVKAATRPQPPKMDPVKPTA